MATEQSQRTEQPPDPQLRRTGRKLSVPGLWFTAIGIVPLVAGVLLVVLASGWAWTLGIVLIVLSLPIHGVGFALLLGGGVAEWASRRWPFA
jgi:hypothetical protein